MLPVGRGHRPRLQRCQSLPPGRSRYKVLPARQKRLSRRNCGKFLLLESLPGRPCALPHLLLGKFPPYVTVVRSYEDTNSTNLHEGSTLQTQILLYKMTRFHSKESPPKLTNNPTRSFEAAR